MAGAGAAALVDPPSIAEASTTGRSRRSAPGVMWLWLGRPARIVAGAL